MYEPQEISGGHRFKQLSAGSTLTCGIDVDYKAWCFGEPNLRRAVALLCLTRAMHGPA